jgi:LysM repeat protein
MLTSLARIGLPVLAGLALLGLSSCGDDDGAATVSTVQIKPSSYSVKDPATTTTVPTSAVAGADGKSAAEQTYIVQSNSDVPFNIARKFGISLDELRNYNGWDAKYSQFPGKGGTVRIPPGAIFVDPNATTTTSAGTTTVTGSTSSTGSTGSSGSTPASGSSGDRCHPTYEVQSGDAPLVITRKFDITIDQLINLPPPADSANAVTTTTTVAPG